MRVFLVCFVAPVHGILQAVWFPPQLYWRIYLPDTWCLFVAVLTPSELGLPSSFERSPLNAWCNQNINSCYLVSGATGASVVCNVLVVLSILTASRGWVMTTVVLM